MSGVAEEEQDMRFYSEEMNNMMQSELDRRILESNFQDGTDPSNTFNVSDWV